MNNISDPFTKVILLLVRSAHMGPKVNKAVQRTAISPAIVFFKTFCFSLNLTGTLNLTKIIHYFNRVKYSCIGYIVITSYCPCYLWSYINYFPCMYRFYLTYCPVCQIYFYIWVLISCQVN